MSDTRTLTFEEFKALRVKSDTLTTSSQTSLNAASASITKVEKKLPKVDAAITKLDNDVAKLQDSQDNLEATIKFPDMVTATAALEQALSKIRVLEYRIKEEIEEKTRYKKKFTDASIEALRAKKDVKSLTKTVAEQSLELDSVRAEHREMITDVRTDIEQYMKESAEGYKRREAANDAYVAELEEALDMQRTIKYARADRIQCVASSALWSN